MQNREVECNKSETRCWQWQQSSRMNCVGGRRNVDNC